MLRLMIIIALSTAVTNFAVAAPITYDFTGTVTRATPSTFPPFDVSVGDKIAITLTLDNAFPDTDPSPDVGLYDTVFVTAPPKSPVLGVKVAGIEVTGFFGRVIIVNEKQ
jgi:hypothetical protein